VSKLSRYDLLLGVVKAEAYFAFNGEDVQYGIEADRRSKILRTFVRNTYSYHLSEILATIVNEYTDWERPVQHPINIRDETLEALSDAQYVAPVVHTADLHSAEHRNSFLYVFDYQTKFGDYPQVRTPLVDSLTSELPKRDLLWKFFGFMCFCCEGRLGAKPKSDSQN
jgi:neuroligin